MEMQEETFSLNSQTKNMRILLFFSVIFSFIVVVTSWLIHLNSGRSRIFLPFISETDTDFLEGTIFSIGLTIVGLTYPILGWYFYRSKKLELKNSDCGETQELLNKIALGVSFFQAISIILVSNLAWFKYPILHAIFANFTFSGGLLWAVLYHKLDYDIDKTNSTKRNYYDLRSNLFVVWFVGIGLMLVGFVSGLSQNPDLLQTLDFSSVRTDMLVAAIGEWIMFLASIVVFATFYEDLIDLD